MNPSLLRKATPKFGVWVKRIGLGFGTVALVIAGAASFAAFEAHVVNVTAKIENALYVHPESRNFGTVFPQEYLKKGIFITFSESFSEADQNRVTKVDYVIKQKPKPRTDTPEERTWCHDSWPPVDPGDPNDPYYVRCYPFLGPYLSKTPANLDGNDVGVPAFHDPFDLTMVAKGTIDKEGVFVGDNWVIDLAVPCFTGFCSQDWADFVRQHNPSVTDPSIYTLDPRLEHQIFGADLWVEVTKIY